jgi:hypothetical protein
VLVSGSAVHMQRDLHSFAEKAISLLVWHALGRMSADSCVTTCVTVQQWVCTQCPYKDMHKCMQQCECQLGWWGDRACMQGVLAPRCCQILRLSCIL